MRLKPFGIVLAATAILVLFLAFLTPSGSPASDENTDPTLGETAWGDYVTDSMREHYRCDLAMIDAGTLATLTQMEIISESVTRLDIAEVEVVTIRLTGSDLVRILNNSLKFFPRKNNGFLQVSGLVIKVDQGSRQRKVVGASINGKPIEGDKIYTIAVTKFLANGGASFNLLDEIIIVEGSKRFVGELIAEYYVEHQEMPKVGSRYKITG